MRPLHFRLKWKRQERHLTQAQAAKALGVSKYTICRWENGATIHPYLVAAVEAWIAG